MKTIGAAALVILSAHWTLASNFKLPDLKYDLRNPGSLPGTPASGHLLLETPLLEVARSSKPRVLSGRIGRDGIIVPTTPLGTYTRDSQNFDLIDRDFKLRIEQAPQMDQDMLVAPDAQRSGLTSR